MLMSTRGVALVDTLAVPRSEEVADRRRPELWRRLDVEGAEVHAEQPVGMAPCQLDRDPRSDVAAVRPEGLIAEPVAHQPRPHIGDGAPEHAGLDTVTVDRSENPKPGIDMTTTSNASSTQPPGATGQRPGESPPWERVAAAAWDWGLGAPLRDQPREAARWELAPAARVSAGRRP